MKKFITRFLNFSLLLAFLLAPSVPSQAQQKGQFSLQLDHEGGKRDVAFIVPTSYTEAKKWAVVVGMHPYATEEYAMRDMLKGAATQLNFILACPDDQPNYDGRIIGTIITYLKANYKIDESNIVVTGYSAGGNGTFGYGLANFEKFKGLIGIATCPNSSPASVQAALKVLPIGFVVGTADSYYSEIQGWVEEAQEYNAVTKVIAKNGVGHTGEYFWGADFTTDWVSLYNFVQTTEMPPAEISLVYPESEATEISVPVKFTWNKVSKAKSYEFQLSEKEDFSTTKETKTVTDTFYSAKTLSNNTTYYWRVRGKNTGGNGPWSWARSFETKKTIPLDAPVVVTPENGAQDLDVPVKFEWNVVDLATKYKLQVFEQGISSPVVNQDIAAPEGDKAEFSAATLKKGKNFTWKLRGASADGDGPWTEVYTFSTKPDLPSDKPKAQYPPENAANMALSIDFEWSLVSGATSYNFSAREDGSSEAAITENGIPATQGKIVHTVSGFKSLTKYYWKTNGSNNAGDGPWSDEASFTTGNYTSVDDGVNSVGAITVTPNPAVDYFVLTCGSGLLSPAGVAVFNFTGEKVPVTFSDGDGKSLIARTGGLPTGMYLVRVTTGKDYSYFKLIVQ